MPSLVEIMAEWSMKRILFKFAYVFSQFRNNLPLEKDGALDLHKIEFPSLKDELCQVKLQLAERFLRRRILKFVKWMYFRYFVIISPWKGAGPFIWTNLNLLYQSMLRVNFGWNYGPVVFEKNTF